MKLPLGPMTGGRLVFAALLFYVLPGLTGAWFAVLIVKKTEQAYLKTPAVWDFALRVVVSSISFALGSMVGLGLAGRWLATASLTADLSFSLLMGALAGIAAYFLTRAIHRHPSP